MRQRNRSGSVVLDRRIKTWNFFFWENGKRRSKKIGTVSQFPTKASAWQAAKPLRDAVENRVRVSNEAPTVNTLVEQYRAEKMPKRSDTRRSYEVWISNYILPKWGECTLSDLQARPVELWIESLKLAPKSKAHIRGVLSILWDFAMWRGDVPTQRNPIELVTIKHATKRTKKPRSLTVEEFQRFIRHLGEPFRTMALLCVCFGLRISEALALKLEWVDADEKRKTFLEADRVVVRVRRNDPRHENFVKAVYLFVSTALLYRAKRYISPPQGKAIDLFVSAEIFREQKPEVVDYFLEEYLHPHIDDGSARVTRLFETFDIVSKAGLFFPVFLQEMDYLGQKVFGRGKSQEVVVEVDALVEFLKILSERRVGDEQTDLNFVQRYCRFAVVIVGKPAKVSQSIKPYVNFVRDGLERNIETVYLIGRAENEKPIQQVCRELSDSYTKVAEKKMSKIVMYGSEKKKIDGFVAVLRSNNRQLFVPTNVEL